MAEITESARKPGNIEQCCVSYLTKRTPRMMMMMNYISIVTCGLYLNLAIIKHFRFRDVRAALKTKTSLIRN